MVIESTEILTGGDDLFDHRRFVSHYNFLLEGYIPAKNKPFAFYLPCSKHKPYYKSPYHRVFTGMINKRLGILEISQKYTVSEPAVLVPRELEDTNVTRYDFPPDQLGESGRRLFIERLSRVLTKIAGYHAYHFYILPKHHRLIFESALDLAAIKDGLFKYGPPVTFNLPKVRKLVRESVLGTKWENHVIMEDIKK